MKPAKKKPARKTVTAWIYTVKDLDGFEIKGDSVRRIAVETRDWDKEYGETVGPLTRIEVLLPEGKK